MSRPSKIVMRQARAWAEIVLSNWCSGPSTSSQSDLDDWYAYRARCLEDASAFLKASIAHSPPASLEELKEIQAVISFAGRSDFYRPPNGRISVHAMSGGLPGLGKR